MVRVLFYCFKNGLEICRILNGMWYVFGSYGLINLNKVFWEMFKYFDVGLIIFDMVDIYGFVEDIFGDFLEYLKVEWGEEFVGKV